MFGNNNFYENSDVLKVSPVKLSKEDLSIDIKAEIKRQQELSKKENCFSSPIPFEVKVKNFTLKFVRLKCPEIMYLTAFGSDAKTILIKGYVESYNTENLMLSH